MTVKYVIEMLSPMNRISFVGFIVKNKKTGQDPDEYNIALICIVFTRKFKS